MLTFRAAPGRCYFCGQPFGRKGTPRARTIDHLTLLGRGGDDAAANRAAACRGCNEEKSDMTVDEYRQWIDAGRPVAWLRAHTHRRRQEKAEAMARSTRRDEEP